MREQTRKSRTRLYCVATRQARLRQTPARRARRIVHAVTMYGVDRTCRNPDRQRRAEGSRGLRRRKRKRKSRIFHHVMSSPYIGPQNAFDFPSPPQDGCPNSETASRNEVLGNKRREKNKKHRRGSSEWPFQCLLSCIVDVTFHYVLRDRPCPLTDRRAGIKRKTKNVRGRIFSGQ